MAIWSMCANSNGSEYSWNLAWATPCGDGGSGAFPGYGCTLFSSSVSAVSSGMMDESSRYSDSAIIYSLRFSLINSSISLLCFSTKAAVAALQTIQNGSFEILFTKKIFKNHTISRDGRVID